MNVTEKYNKAIKYLANKRYDKALPLFKTALKQKPCKEGWLNLGAVYKQQENFEESWKCFEKANDPKLPYFDGSKADHDPMALHNLGSLIYRTEDNDELARQYYMDAWLVDKDTVSAAWNYGITGIRQYCDGDHTIDLKKMWKYYTYRFGTMDLYVMKEHELWDGVTEHLDSELVLLKDQGMGDMFMFSRYIPFVEKYFKKVYVQCEDSLAGLYKNRYTEDCTAKYCYPMNNLGVLLDYIPSGDWLADKYNAKIGGEFAIGCVWSGNVNFENDKWRSCSPELFDSIDCKKYTFAPNPSRYTYLPGLTWIDTIKNLEQ
jgi:tetratricopeptide (TPR) repeat protein